MKTLYFQNEEFQAEKIVKTEISILGYSNNSEVFSFKGICDFDNFKLKEGETFDIDEIQMLKESKEVLDDLIQLLLDKGVIL